MRQLEVETGQTNDKALIPLGKPQVSVLAPCHNEEKNLAPLLAEIPRKTRCQIATTANPTEEK